MVRKKTKHRHIALMIDTSRAYGRGVCEGVADFCEQKSDWLLLPYERPAGGHIPDWMKPPYIDGVIAYIADHDMAEKLFGLGVPVVDVHGRYRHADVALVESDSKQIVGLATDFFLNSGFRNLAYCGFPGVFFSDHREQEFHRIVTEHKMTPHVYHPETRGEMEEDIFVYERNSQADEAKLVRWLKKLPRPTAILACNDIRGQQVVNACREAGISVPEEVAVMGIDNDELLCRLCRPTLSSINQDLRRIGMLAGEQLAHALEGKPGKPGVTRVPPLRIVERKSTDIIAADNQLVIRTGRILRERALSGVSVKAICNELKCSRPKLDALFIAAIGRTVSAEISRLRLNTAKQLLTETKDPLHEIARRCGFTSDTYFCRFFRRETRLSPAEFRNGEAKNRGKPPRR